MFKTLIKYFTTLLLLCSFVSCASTQTNSKSVNSLDEQSLKVSDGKDSLIVLNLVLAIEQSVEKVFAYLIDPKSVPEWQTDILKQVKITDGPMRHGTRLLNTKKSLWGNYDYEREVVDFVPLKSFSFFNYDKSLKFKIKYVLEAVNGNTQIAVTGEFEKPVTGPYSLLPRWILKYGIKKVFLNHNRLLKLNIEKKLFKK